jgi:hypothetical protein
MNKFIKKLFCKHTYKCMYKYDTDVYLFECSKCGKRKVIYSTFFNRKTAKTIIKMWKKHEIEINFAGDLTNE